MINSATQKDMIDYRNKIMSRFINSQELVSLIDPSYIGKEDGLIYQRIFPYEYIPDVAESVNNYILFDIDVDLNKQNSIINSFTLYVYLIVHVDALQTAEGLRSDLMVVEIEKIFKGQNVLGIGEMKLVFNHKYHAGERFRGRVLCFKLVDFVNEPRLAK